MTPNLAQSLNPRYEHISDWVEVDEVIVNRYSVAATTCIDYTVWEKTRWNARTHTTITSQEPYGQLGDLTTRVLTPELEALPTRTRERSDAVQAFFRSLEQQAERYIRRAFPKDFLGEEIKTCHRVLVLAHNVYKGEVGTVFDICTGLDGKPGYITWLDNGGQALFPRESITRIGD